MLIYFLILLITSTCNSIMIPTNFEHALKHGYSDEQYTELLKQKVQRDAIPFLKKLYEENLLKLKTKTSTNTIIPKIIHQIWLGSPLPEKYIFFQKTWKHFHPNWEYKLWTDQDIESFKLINKDAFDKAVSYAERANLLRLEILERYGGIYVDSDFECLQSFDFFNENFEFYAGITPAIRRQSIISNALIASIAHHPILQACIKKINKTDYTITQMHRNGTVHFSKTILDECANNQTINLSKIVFLPPEFFYPLSTADAPRSLITISSFATHHWAGSWHDKKTWLT